MRKLLLNLFRYAADTDTDGADTDYNDVDWSQFDSADDIDAAGLGNDGHYGDVDYYNDEWDGDDDGYISEDDVNDKWNSSDDEKDYENYVNTVYGGEAGVDNYLKTVEDFKNSNPNDKGYQDLKNRLQAQENKSAAGFDKYIYQNTYGKKAAKQEEKDEHLLNKAEENKQAIMNIVAEMHRQGIPVSNKFSNKASIFNANLVLNNLLGNKNFLQSGFSFINNKLGNGLGKIIGQQTPYSSKEYWDAIAAGATPKEAEEALKDPTTLELLKAFGKDTLNAYSAIQLANLAKNLGLAGLQKVGEAASKANTLGMMKGKASSKVLEAASNLGGRANTVGTNGTNRVLNTISNSFDTPRNILGSAASTAVGSIGANFIEPEETTNTVKENVSKSTNKENNETVGKTDNTSTKTENNETIGKTDEEYKNEDSGSDTIETTVQDAPTGGIGQDTFKNPNNDNKSFGLGEEDPNRANYDLDDWNRGMETVSTDVVSDEKVKHFIKHSYSKDPVLIKAVKIIKTYK